MLDHMALYDTLYLLAADDGREERLFGSCQPLARKAFRRSLVGDKFPTIWFEVPLTGTPRFDLHVAISRTALVPGVEFAAGVESGYGELFRWYAENEPGGAGLALAYDVSAGNIDQAAVHANVNNSPLADMGRFFDLAAGKGAAERYRAFAARLPKGWRVWYAGFHPGRPHTPVRIDCFVDDRLKAAYASTPSLLEAHLQSCGFTATSAKLHGLASLVAKSPFSLELQFDVLSDGSVGSTIGVSAGFPVGPASKVLPLFEGTGEAAGLLERIEAHGLADSRWRLIGDTIYTGLVNTATGPLALYDAPTFVKLRVRDGNPLDAKIYLQAGARTGAEFSSSKSNGADSAPVGHASIHARRSGIVS